MKMISLKLNPIMAITLLLSACSSEEDKTDSTIVDNEESTFSFTVVPTENPDDIFKHLILPQIPNAVTNLQGGGLQWQGHGVYVRFNASDEIIDSIITERFKECEPADAMEHLNNPGKSSNFFDPEWNIDINSSRFFKEQPANNDWTTDGFNVIAIDGNVVYFYGFGT